MQFFKYSQVSFCANHFNADLKLCDSKNPRDVLNHGEIAVAGALSGAIGRVCIQPLDVIKTRFQLQVEPIKRGEIASKYQSTFQATKLIFKEEGITAFWKGHVPAQLLSTVFGIVQFWSFNALITQCKRYNIYDEHKGIISFVAGTISGSCSTVITFPFDTLRTRQIAQSDKIYRNVLQAFTHMIRNEGVFVMYQGMTPSLVSIAPNCGLQFMIYNFVDTHYKKIAGVKGGAEGYSLPSSMVAGSIAGLISKLAIYPLDLTRKRMQIQGFQEHRSGFGINFTCRNMMHCTYKTFETEGIGGLFKGGIPSMYKAVLTSGLNFAVFEAVIQLIADFKYTEQ